MGTNRLERCGVYPRLCGGTGRASVVWSEHLGLSPPVRGNPAADARSATSRRSIPACAGEPPPPPQGKGFRGVYPRLCGGTRPRGCRAYRARGLSPPVRGNQPMEGGGGVKLRSIPACAGEPHGRGRRETSATVYPRLCGGTPPAARPVPIIRGLSPPVRGNLDCVNLIIPPLGSIPACAGEPWHSPAARNPPRVYPRLCGGTIIPRPRGETGKGLSPPVRGNPGANAGGGRRPRSIPACAGEP